MRPKTTAASKTLTKGWHQFQIDFNPRVFRAYIEQIPVKNYELAKDQNFQYLSLRLIPSSIYKNIQLYLGSKRLWIYPRNLLRSKSMKMDNLSAEQKSNLHFHFIETLIVLLPKYLSISEIHLMVPMNSLRLVTQVRKGQ